MRNRTMRNRTMRYAGIMSPPPQMTKDIYDYVISQVATNYVHALKEKLLGAEKFRKEESKQYKPLLDSIRELRSAVSKGGTREVFKAYKEFAIMSSAFFGMGYAEDYKMKVFSGVKDPSRRSEVRELVERHIERNLLAMENRLSFFEKRTPVYKKLLKEFQALIVEKLPPMEGRESAIRKFPIDIDDWYIGQEKIEEHQEVFRAEERKRILEDLEDNEERFRRFGHIPNGGYERDYYEEKKKRLNKKLNAIDNSLLMSDIEYLGEITVEVGYNDTSFWAPHLGLLFISIDDVGADIERALYLDVQHIVIGVHRKVVHEMTHAGQTILSIVKSKITDLHKAYSSDKNKGTDLLSGGLPSKKIRTPEYKQKGPKALKEHHLDDVEFYTDLRDAIRIILIHMKKLNAQANEKNIVFKDLVGIEISKAERELVEDLSITEQIPFFMNLKKFAPAKWKKAVGEAYKMVFNTRDTRLKTPKTKAQPLPIEELRDLYRKARSQNDMRAMERLKELGQASGRGNIPNEADLRDFESLKAYFNS